MAEVSTARRIVDDTAHAFGTVARGVIPLAIGSVAGVEAFAPTLLPFVTMSHDFAVSAFAASVAVLVPNLRMSKAG